MNKKVASRRPKSGHDLAKSAAPVRMRHLERQSRDLGQEIHRLECTIAAAPRVMRQQRLATLDTLPPPERTFSPARRRTKRLPLQQQRAIKRQRMGLIIELAVVVTVLAAALGWMNQWFHFWN